MTELISDLEKASGPGRELDCAIYIWLGAMSPTESDPLYWTAPGGLSRHYESLVPRFTGDIEAALGLLPEGAWWCLSGPHTLKGGLYREGPKRYDAVATGSQEGLGATPAIALCVLGLRVAITAGHRE